MAEGSDWTIEVDMITKNLESAFQGANVGGGTSGSEGVENAMAGGVSKGMKMAGIVAILTQLKVVTDSIGFILATVSSLISFFVVSFIQNVMGFFQDPVRSLLELGVWMVNGIISGIEMLANAIVPTALQPEGGFDFGEISTEEVIEAYDLAKEASKEMADGLKITGEDTAVKIEDGASSMAGSIIDAMDSAKDVFDDLKDEIKAAGRQMKTSGGFSFDAQREIQRYATGPSIAEIKRMGANNTLKYSSRF